MAKAKKKAPGIKMSHSAEEAETWRKRGTVVTLEMSLEEAKSLLECLDTAPHNIDAIRDALDSLELE